MFQKNIKNCLYPLALLFFITACKKEEYAIPDPKPNFPTMRLKEASVRIW